MPSPSVAPLWPWFVTGPILGAMVPILLWLGNRSLGFSSNFRHLCAVVVPVRGPEYLRYAWRTAGGWNLLFSLGVVAGGVVGNAVVAGRDLPVAAATRDALTGLGISDFTGLVPAELFGAGALGTVRGLFLMLFGGLCIGFGSAWAGGCTSGHGIAGLGALQKASAIAVAAFLVGGVIGTHLVLPLVMRLS